MKHLRWMALCLISLIFVFWLESCSVAPTQVVNLNFAAAGMMRGAVEELDRLYQQEHPNVVVNYSFAGTRAIETAIEQGEAFDGILLAEIPPLDRLQAKGLILPASRKELVTTDIVVIAPVDSAVKLSDFRELASDRIKTVAMGGKGPAVGKYTRDILNRLGIAQIVESKALLTEVDVREVLIAVERQEAQVGITFLSEAKTSTKVKVLATASTDLYKPIRAVAAVVKRSTHTQEMQTYLDFLSSDRVKAAFPKYGLRPLVS
ncbi:Molybdate ABC transporter substrate-binding protein [Nostoc sp. DSM 114161]|jgi:molybdate transport system substrate-binding protein|uniref:molybdate ABC transporter substrate-binding protein n=1 Tax=Nostoc sp. DSM 114161 TaxID=3440143 RepID=UPI0040460A13